MSHYLLIGTEGFKVTGTLYYFYYRSTIIIIIINYYYLLLIVPKPGKARHAVTCPALPVAAMAAVT